jgi:hypothetical protein
MHRRLTWLIWFVTGALIVTVGFNAARAFTAPAQIGPVVTSELQHRAVGAKARVWATRQVDAFALAHWTQAGVDGQALLQQRNGQWRLIELGGGAMNASLLMQLGVPNEPTAARLLTLQKTGGTQS